ncbi:MAG: 4-hydroxy-tetrahydrodipicolinate synthase [Fusobacteriaceae bacterium]|nr:4-hydroxy-tetrahydrodipicolinate synthase [Fusobacteriaceae bacterium]
MSLFTGSGVALITPFHQDGSVNYEKLQELVEFHIKNETDAIIVAGTTGEASTLPDAEHVEVVRKTVEFANKRIPVIGGSGSNDTSYAIELSKKLEACGVDGLLVVTPYYNRSNNSGYIKHYEAIANAVNVPIILYNVPGRTGVKLPLEVLKSLSEHKNIIGIKEASGDMTYVSDIARICGPDFDIYSGNDDIIVPTMSIGGIGVISVLANVLPKETHDMCQFYLDGKVKESRDLQLKYNGFVHSLFTETNPIPVKKAMNLLNMNVGPLRMPLDELSECATKILIEEMRKIGLEV